MHLVEKKPFSLESKHRQSYQNYKKSSKRYQYSDFDSNVLLLKCGLIFPKIFLILRRICGFMACSQKNLELTLLYVCNVTIDISTMGISHGISDQIGQP